MVNISCISKFWAFSLSEQLNRFGLLNTLYTSFHSEEHPIFKKISSRRDNEIIPLEKVKTFPILLPAIKVLDPFARMQVFDYLVKRQLKKNPEYKVLIGWSGMSLESFKQAKRDKKKTILERGSSHIVYQNRILSEEYAQYKIKYSIDKRVIAKELKEYEMADFIVVPSEFVKRSFVEEGVDENKIFKNNFGSSDIFKSQESTKERRPFRILFLGRLSIRKGLKYLFNALKDLDDENIEAWFIGKIEDEIKAELDNYVSKKWKFFGHVPHHELPQYISKCDIGVVPSIEEGFGMIIPQILSCGVPVIATENTGGKDIITDGVNGFVIPIRSSDSIKNKLSLLMNNQNHCEISGRMKHAENDFSWDSYGERYSAFLQKLL